MYYKFSITIEGAIEIPDELNIATDAETVSSIILAKAGLVYDDVIDNRTITNCGIKMSAINVINMPDGATMHSQDIDAEEIKFPVSLKARQKRKQNNQSGLSNFFK